MARKAVFGPLIFERVEDMTADSDMTKADAFRWIAQHKRRAGLDAMTISSPGHIAAAYYRESRSRSRKHRNSDTLQRWHDVFDAARLEGRDYPEARRLADQQICPAA